MQASYLLDYFKNSEKQVLICRSQTVGYIKGKVMWETCLQQEGDIVFKDKETFNNILQSANFLTLLIKSVCKLRS